MIHPMQLPKPKVGRHRKCESCLEVFRESQGRWWRTTELWLCDTCFDEWMSYDQDEFE